MLLFFITISFFFFKYHSREFIDRDQVATTKLHACFLSDSNSFCWWWNKSIRVEPLACLNCPLDAAAGSVAPVLEPITWQCGE